MAEQIYTIPINEAFDNAISGDAYDCPFCLLEKMLEDSEIEMALGPAMMEPDVRTEMNKKGFCKHHFEKLDQHEGKKLPLALIMESHLAEVRKKCFGILMDPKSERQQGKIEELEQSCYICDHLHQTLGRMFNNMVYMYETDDEFRTKFKNQKYFCLHHYQTMLEFGRDFLPKKLFAEYAKTAESIEKKYLEELNDDVSWFCKKFDYRYDAEPWYNAKDSLPRTFNFLVGDESIK